MSINQSVFKGQPYNLVFGAMHADGSASVFAFRPRAPRDGDRFVATVGQERAVPGFMSNNPQGWRDSVIAREFEKLGQDVFKGQPAHLIYAAVGADTYASLYEVPPTIYEAGECWDTLGGWRNIGGGFDAEGWRDSVIKHK